MINIGAILGLYRDNGKKTGNYYLKLRCLGNEDPFKGLGKRILMIIPIPGRGFANKGSTLGSKRCLPRDER